MESTNVMHHQPDESQLSTIFCLKTIQISVITVTLYQGKKLYIVFYIIWAATHPLSPVTLET